MIFFVPLGLGTYLVLKEIYYRRNAYCSTAYELYSILYLVFCNYNKIKGIKPINEKLESIIEESNGEILEC